MNKNPIVAFVSTAFFLGLASYSGAAISSTASITVQNPLLADGASLNVTTSNWSLNGGNTVALLFTAENTNSFTATFAGQTMDVLGIDNSALSPQSPQFTGIAYLVDPSNSTGDVVISAAFSGSGRLSSHYSLVSLAGVAPNPILVSGILDQRFLFAAGANGGFILGTAGVDGSTAPRLSGFSSMLFSGESDSNHSVAHAMVGLGPSGSLSSRATTMDVAAFAFFEALAPVPEPASSLLLGIGGIALIRRRKR